MVCQKNNIIVTGCSFATSRACVCVCIFYVYCDDDDILWCCTLCELFFALASLFTCRDLAMFDGRVRPNPERNEDEYVVRCRLPVPNAWSRFILRKGSDATRSSRNKYAATFRPFVHLRCLVLRTCSVFDIRFT